MTWRSKHTVNPKEHHSVEPFRERSTTQSITQYEEWRVQLKLILIVQ